MSACKIHSPSSFVHRGRDDQHQNRCDDVAGFLGHLPQHATVQLALEHGDDQRTQRTDGAGLGRRKHAAVDAA
jgi:hypothetical protein